MSRWAMRLPIVARRSPAITTPSRYVAATIVVACGARPAAEPGGSGRRPGSSSGAALVRKSVNEEIPAKQLAIEMDKQILGGYRLFPVHYLAYAQWQDVDPQLQVPRASEIFPADELAKAQDQWQQRLDACPEEHRPFLVLQYATPVRNQYRVKAGLPL